LITNGKTEDLTVIDKGRLSALKSFSIGKGEVYFQKYLSDTSLIFFTKLGEVVLIEVDPQGFPNIQNPPSFKLKFYEENVTCNDASYLGTDFSTIIILCWKESAAGQVSLWI